MAQFMLRINLSELSVNIEEIPPKIMKDYIGGRGLGAYFLYHFVPQGADPLGDDNHLIFTVGPATGTGAHWSSKICLNTKSPYTGLYLNSLSSGNLPHQIKKAGYWIIDIYGTAPRPTYFVIDDGQVQFYDATHIWGMEVALAQEKMLEATGMDDATALSIGPAGEHLLPYAAIFNDGSRYRTFGRGGGGSVLGAKGLKGFVVRGTQPIEIRNRDAFRGHNKKMLEILKKSPAKEWAEWWRRYETGADLDVLNALGIIPTHNWQKSQFDGWSGVCKSTTPMGWPEKNRACGPYCPTPGCRDAVVSTGPYKGAHCDIEWEAIYAFGTTCGVDKMEAVIAANQLCDEFGIDTISTGVTIGFAMECFEKGLIGLDETDGIDLRFGNDAAMVAMIRKIVNQEGFGKKLARGTKWLSEQIKGSTSFAMHVKGLEMGGYECRDLHGQSLEFAVNPRGGCHHGYGIPARDETQDGSQLQVEEKGVYLKELGANKILRDSLPVCVFVRPYADSALMTELVSAIIGQPWTLDDLTLFGERVMALERLFNMREAGLTRDDDVLPDRITKEPKPDGPNRGYDKMNIEMLKDVYYTAMGYDLSTGNPPAKLIARLGIEK